jgi:UDP:flavonoid glycosyltransferase YjiC (YdhE family)
VHALGVGPRPIQRRALTVPRLTEAISSAVDDETIRHNAAVLGERIRDEEGVQSAVDFISDYLGN